MPPSFRDLSFCVLGVLLHVTGCVGSASAKDPPDSNTVVLAPEFTKEWPYGILFGRHHQSLWTTPITIEVLNLASYAGGLSPDREIVTPETRTLVLNASNGSAVAFTPLRERFADDEADPRDKRLIPAHPTSALAADALGKAAGLFQARRQLVWLPDDSLLGSFRRTYGGSAGFLASLDTVAQGAPVQLIQSQELFYALDADSRNSVDSQAYLLSRFIDLLSGDWQRSAWKWWWITINNEQRNVYTPMPTLRRQSLLMLSSFPSFVHSLLTPGFVNFTGELPDVSRAVATGAALDSRILASVNRTAWESIARDFVSSISDSVIDAAIAALPPPHRRAEGDTLAHMLRSRRDAFAEVSRQYYLTLAEYIEIWLGNTSEYVTIDRQEDGHVAVTAWQRTERAEQVFHRIFLPEETQEIRLHCLGGNDTVLVKGASERSIVVRVNGGPGDDVLRDESTVGNAQSGLLDFLSGSTMTFLYDHEGVNDLKGGKATTTDTTSPREFVPPGRFF